MVPAMPIYLDCAATTPLDPRVRAEMLRYLDDDFGNAGSRTHAWGHRARRAVEQARDRVAAVAGAGRGDVVFTSGATESNNLAILGLLAAESSGHVVTTAIEHRAVLEPVAELARRGFDVTYVPPEADGAVDPDALLSAVRPTTRLVSVMHVNNETGVIQPIESIAHRLPEDGPYMHVDAAQSFGREIPALRHPRIDLISVSAHKIQGPKGAGALIVRRRGGRRPPVQPLMFGGGQERGLRPGTVPVAMVAGFGLAAELAMAEGVERGAQCLAFRESLLRGLAPLEPAINGDLARSVPYIVNVSFPGLQAEALIDAWQDLVAISDGAACSSQSYTCSHVLGAMRLPAGRAEGAVRLSWCAATAVPDWNRLVAAAASHRTLQGAARA
jgi:cysteine desulfurase